MYMAVCLIKKFDHDGQKPQDIEIFEYAMKDLFSKMQLAFEGIYQNIFTSNLRSKHTGNRIQSNF